MNFQYGVPPHLDKEIEVRLKEVEGHWLIDGLTPLTTVGTAAPKPVPAPGTKKKATR